MEFVGALIFVGFFVFCGYLGVRIGRRKGARIKQGKAEIQRVDTLEVSLAPAQVRKIAREETDGPWWQRDYDEDVVGYVHSDALTTGTGIGFGVRAIERGGGSTVTVFPYARGMSLRDVQGYGALEFAVDSLSLARAFQKIAPVRQRVINRLMVHATAPLVSEVFD